MSKVVVYIDDEESLCELFQWHLELEAFTVRTFVDPVEALSFVHSSDVMLIICDYRMPGLDGLTFLTRLNKNIPFFLVTGDLEVNEQITSDARLKQILFKPIDYEKATKLIRSIMDQQ